MNHLCVLKHYKDTLMDVSIEDVMAEFISNIESRVNTFGNVKK